MITNVSIYKNCFRCDVANAKLTKSQKKVIKRFNRFLLTGEKPQHNPQKSNDKQTYHTPIVEECKDEPPNLQKMETSEIERLTKKDTVPPVQVNTLFDAWKKPDFLTHIARAF